MWMIQKAGSRRYLLHQFLISTTRNRLLAKSRMAKQRECFIFPQQLHVIGGFHNVLELET